MHDFEKLGAFYLGRRRDPASGETTDEPVLYDAKDLTTHAVCVGMTGSGKTGLCLSLLEEAALDGVPVLAIDPKGDLGNLLLTFPKLRPADFEPWIDPGQATRNGQTVQQYASQVSQLWKNGLASWGQNGQRINKLRDSAEFSIYTPGSSAGLPLSVIRSFAAPGEAVIADADAMRDRVTGTASGLLALLGLDADPITSRDHILISNILERNWREGISLTIADLIRAIQQPGFDRVGILELESFYPEKDRFKLSMMINNLLASPSFSSWMTGEPLDIQRLLYQPNGKPRVSILSIAHLNDDERMFFVTMVLNELLSWMRTQPGTSSLRAILYMDEVFGYFPPTANPPSKMPMLTLLKQARAFGVGIVLATQNPVDLDYKGLSNTGTWFLGRLQTERDKMRVLEGLEGADQSGGTPFDRQAMEQTLAGLGNRVFLLHNVHDDQPTLFETRWAMSYLRGPLTRQQIKQLMAEKAKQTQSKEVEEKNRLSQSLEQPVVAATLAESSPKNSDDDPSATAEDVDDESNDDVRDQIPTSIEQRYLPIAHGSVEDRRLVYRAQLFGHCDIHFKRTTYGIDHWRSLALISSRPTTQSGWKESIEWPTEQEPLKDAPAANGQYEAPSASLLKSKNFTSWKSQLKHYVYQQRRLTIWQCKELKALSNVGESEGDFRARLAHLAHERRDLEVEKLKSKFSSKLATIKDRLERAKQRVEVQREQYTSKRFDSIVSVGQTLIGALLGRKLASKTNLGKAGTSARSVQRAAKERGDIADAEKDVKKYEAQLKELEKEFQEDVSVLEQKLDANNLILKEITIAPLKTDTQVHHLSLLWVPWWVSSAGIAEPAWSTESANLS